MHNCQPCMKDYAHTQKPSPGRVLQRRQRINICWLADRWIDRVNEAWQHCCSVTSETVNLKSWLWHPYTHTHTLHTHPHTHTHPWSYPQAVARKTSSLLQGCAVSGYTAPVYDAKPYAFPNLLHPSNFSFWDTEGQLRVFPTLSSSTFWNIRCFWRWAH